MVFSHTNHPRYERNSVKMQGLKSEAIHRVNEINMEGEMSHIS